MAKDALKIITKGLNIKFYLHLYFGNPKHVLPDILDFPIHGIGLNSLKVDDLGDFTMGDKGLALGCVDASNTRIEQPNQIAKEAKKICTVLKPRELYLCPNYDLEYIPHLYARRKIIKLGETLKILRGK
jgi:methionine synthase II (cobalamin-independent)